MDSASARLLVQSLLERLEADSRSNNPQYTAAVSKNDRAAISFLLQEAHVGLQSAPATFAEPPVSQKSNHDATAIDKTANISGTRPLTINTDCLTSIKGHKHVVCIDFGTAKSKAFASACPLPEEDLLNHDLIELNIGQLDDDLDFSPYTVASAVWISDDGRMYVGSMALILSREYSAKGAKRERLDSMKRQLTLGYDDAGVAHPLNAAINPTSTTLTYEESICFFLAYVSDLVGESLSARGLSRYTPKRFTVPAWKTEKRQWAVKTIGRALALSQILADTFRGEWANGIPIIDVKSALEQSRPLIPQLNHLLDKTMLLAHAGISEPVAAGTARLLTDRTLRNLVLVVDVGAGTTDFAMFWVTKDAKGQRAYPVTESVARNMAGDLIDGHLVEFLLSKAGHKNPEVRRDLERSLRLKGLRREKERLFADKIATFDLETDERIEVELAEFLASEGMTNFVSTFEDHLQKFLSTVDVSYKSKAERPVLLLTGGGANLPFVRDLRKRRWVLAGQDAILQRPTRQLGSIFEQFGGAYKQLAVAIGGSLGPIDEREILSTCPGDAPPAPRVSGWV